MLSCHSVLLIRLSLVELRALVILGYILESPQWEATSVCHLSGIESFDDLSLFSHWKQSSALA